ncbi:MAG: glycosyltransferase family 4 protein [Bacteriovoracia bacterium]
MIVVHSCTSDSFSGLERYVLTLAQWQKQQGLKPLLFVRKRSELARAAQAQRIETYEISATAKKNSWLEISKFWKFLAAKNTTIVLHMHAGGEPWFHFPWLSLRPRFLKKAILHYHIWIDHKKKDLVHRFLFRFIDEVWTSSESSRSHLSSLLPIKKEKIKVIAYGRQVEKLKSLDAETLGQNFRLENNIPSDSVVGLCISRIEPIKGVKELFEASIEVIQKHPQFHLVVVGDVSPGNEGAKRYADGIFSQYSRLANSIKSNIHFTGYLSDSSAALCASDFYVLPSYQECMSLAVLDALILSKPVIGTRAGGTPSVVVEQQTGLLVSPANVGELVGALTKLIESIELRKNLSAQAGKLSELFDEKKIFEKIWELYQSSSTIELGA